MQSFSRRSTYHHNSKLKAKGISPVVVMETLLEFIGNKKLRNLFSTKTVK